MQTIMTNMNHVKIVTTVLDNPYGYGRVLHKDGIVRIVEEKDASEEEKQIKNVNCGIYAIDSTLLCKYLPLLKNNNNQREYYLTDIIAFIQSEQIQVDTYTVPKEKQYEIMGVNTLEQLTELEKLNMIQ
jgi:bifunctional UDP-N-acetylglucosamine pyrophosphorylase/glucosamine-1-phosphate N-acetyltransferase